MPAVPPGHHSRPPHLARGRMLGATLLELHAPGDTLQGLRVPGAARGGGHSRRGHACWGRLASAASSEGRLVSAAHAGGCPWRRPRALGLRVLRAPCPDHELQGPPHWCCACRGHERCSCLVGATPAMEGREGREE